MALGLSRGALGDLVTEIERRFEDEMMRLYEEPKRRFGYNATYFLQMIQEHGALEAARRLAREPRHHEGLTRLWQHNALELSVEATVRRAPWRQLFDDEILRAAKRKLEDLHYAGPELED